VVDAAIVIRVTGADNRGITIHLFRAPGRLKYVTLTQLSAFVLVARLGSVKAAAEALGVSEPAVSQALASLRKYFHDSLLVRGANGMELTAGGNRLLGVAAQMVALGAEAEEAVRSAQGQPAQLRLVADSTVVEFVSGALAEAFSQRTSGAVEVTAGVATTAEMAVLVSQRLADLALGPRISADPALALVSEPVVRGNLVVLGPPSAPPGPASGWSWLVDPSGTDPDGDVGRLLRALGVPESRLSVYPNQTAAWDAAAAGTGVAPAIAHLASARLRRPGLRVVPTPRTPMPICWHATTLRPDRRGAAAGSLRHFLGTPEAMRLLRSPGSGVPPSRFRPPVYVTIWS
jgi:LysR family transcriptional regulator, low CO2-responsive transcriptional regulator